MTNINVRVDEKTKKEAEELFERLGLTMSAAMNVFLKQAVREQGIPFSISLNTPNAETLAAIEECEQMISEGKGKRYTSLDELKESLTA